MDTLERRIAVTYLFLEMARCVLTTAQSMVPWRQIPLEVLLPSLAVHGLVALAVGLDLVRRKTSRYRLVGLISIELLALVAFQVWEFNFLTPRSSFVELVVLYSNAINSLTLTVLLAWLVRLVPLLLMVGGWQAITLVSYIVTAAQESSTILFLIAGQATVGAVIGSFVSVLASQQLRDAEELRRKVILQEELSLSWEKNHLARELHDTLAQSLSALSVQLEAVKTVWDRDPAKARAMLDEAHTITGSGLTDTRAALGRLRSGPLKDQGLVLALQQLAEETASRIGADLRLNLPQVLTLELASEVEHGIYRIAQEALQNVVRHSRACVVGLTFQPLPRGLRMEIFDDGVGFASPRVPQGRYGLTGIRERAALMGAEVSIESKPGHGTTVSLEARFR